MTVCFIDVCRMFKRLFAKILLVKIYKSTVFDQISARGASVNLLSFTSAKRSSSER